MFLTYTALWVLTLRITEGFDRRGWNNYIEWKPRASMRVWLQNAANEEHLDNRILSTSPNLWNKIAIASISTIFLANYGTIAIAVEVSTLSTPSIVAQDERVIERDILNSPVEVSIDDAAAFANRLQDSRPLYSDEFRITFSQQSLGIKLIENLYKGFPVVTVREIIDPFLLQNYPELEVGAVLTHVQNEKVDGIFLKDIIPKIQQSGRPITLEFRDPSRFFKLLDSTNGPPKRVITTQYLPANTRDAGTLEQVIRVERLSIPPPEERRRAADMLDVLEIQYVATIAGDESQRIVDSSADRSPPGTSTKSIYYVLGQQNGPPGKFPQGWDLTLRGMVSGEVRRITLPYSLAYDRKGDKLRNIPPFANLIYTVKLKSLT